MQTVINSLLILLSASLGIVAQGGPLKRAQDFDLQFKVLSVGSALRGRSAKPTNDNIGADISVRLELKNIGQKVIYFYTDWSEEIIPFGHTVRETESGFVWLDGIEMTSMKSPGIPKLSLGTGGAWLRLSPGTAIEFELLDSSVSVGRKHAKTIFVKQLKSSDIIEVRSDSYSVSRTP